MAKIPAPEAPKIANTVTITLSEPIPRAGGPVETLTLRKPKAGELRGLKVEDLFHSDINSLIVLLPRISSPTLIAQEIERLETEDLLEVAGAVKGFFMPQKLRDMVAAQFGD